MKKIFVVFIIFLSFVVYFGVISALPSNLNKNILINNNSIGKREKVRVVKVKLIHKFADLNCSEPLMVRAVVFKIYKNKGIALVRIVSETYRGLIMIIKGNLNVKKGYYISGAFCGNDKLFIAPFKGGVK